MMKGEKVKERRSMNMKYVLLNIGSNGEGIIRSETEKVKVMVVFIIIKPLAITAR